MFDVLVDGDCRSFNKTKATIGRAADCDIVLPSIVAGRREAGGSVRRFSSGRLLAWSWAGRSCGDTEIHDDLSSL